MKNFVTKNDKARQAALPCLIIYKSMTKLETNTNITFELASSRVYLARLFIFMLFCGIFRLLHQQLAKVDFYRAENIIHQIFSLARDWSKHVT